MTNIRSLDSQRRWEKMETHLEETTVFTTADLRNGDLVLCAYLKTFLPSPNNRTYTFVGHADEVFRKNSVPFQIMRVSFEDEKVILHVKGKETARKNKKWREEFADITNMDVNTIEFRWVQT